MIHYKKVLFLGLFAMKTLYTTEQKRAFNQISQLYYVTSNPVKYQEGSVFFKQHLPHIKLYQANIDLPEIQTLDQTAIALDKARQAWHHLKQPVLVDDTSIYFDKYPNFPGTMTRFVYQTLGLEGIFRLIETGQGMNIRIVLVLMYGENDYITIDETIYGTITTTHRLDLHKKEAPFDTIFIPDGTTQTVDELRFEGKAEPFLYRMRALKRLRTMFEDAPQLSDISKKTKFRYFIQNKLWRDKMPRESEKKGSVIHVKRLEDEEFDQELRRKLLEEAQEVKAANSQKELIGELADVYEVIETLCALHNIDIHEVITTQLQKRMERGGFMERKYVTIAEHPVGSFLEKYCLADPKKYPEIK